jgi:hypothetical protein
MAAAMNGERTLPGAREVLPTALAVTLAETLLTLPLGFLGSRALAGMSHGHPDGAAALFRDGAYLLVTAFLRDGAGGTALLGQWLLVFLMALPLAWVLRVLLLQTFLARVLGRPPRVLVTRASHVLWRSLAISTFTALLQVFCLGIVWFCAATAHDQWVTTTRERVLDQLFVVALAIGWLPVWLLGVARNLGWIELARKNLPWYVAWRQGFVRLRRAPLRLLSVDAACGLLGLLIFASTVAASGRWQAAHASTAILVMAVLVRRSGLALSALTRLAWFTFATRHGLANDELARARAAALLHAPTDADAAPPAEMH